MGKGSGGVGMWARLALSTYPRRRCSCPSGRYRRTAGAPPGGGSGGRATSPTGRGMRAWGHWRRATRLAAWGCGCCWSSWGPRPPYPPATALTGSAVDQRRAASLTRCSAVAASRLSRAVPILSTSLTNQRTSARSEDTSAIAVAAAPASADPRANAMDMMVSGDIALHRGD